MAVILTSSIHIGLLSETRSFKIIWFLLLKPIYLKVYLSLIGVLLIIHHLELWSLVVFCILLLLVSLVLYFPHFLTFKSRRHALCLNVFLFVRKIGVTALIFIFWRLFIVSYLKVSFQAQFFLNFFFLIKSILILRNVASLYTIS